MRVRHERSAGFVLLGFAAGVQLAVGMLLAKWGLLGAMAVAAVGVLAVSFTLPAWLLALSFPLALNTRRLGGPLDLSVADAVLVFSTLVAVRHVPWQAVAVRRLLWSAGAYLGVLAIAVAATPSLRAELEWLHRGSLLIGSFCVGAAVAYLGRGQTALRGFVIGCLVVATAAIVDAVGSGFAPSYPLGLHKNAAGGFLTTALLMLLCARSVLAWPPRLTIAAQLLLIGGLLACQSRAAAATFALLYMIRALVAGSRSVAALLGVVALSAMIWTTSQRLFDPAQSSKFDSLQTRLDTYDRTMELWRSDPVFGVGLRFWNAPGATSGEPHNVVISALGESGALGVLALVVLHSGAVPAVRRAGGELGDLALFAMVAHVVDSLAGIFWVAGTGTIPWLLVGLAAGRLRAPGGDSTADFAPPASGTAAQVAATALR